MQDNTNKSPTNKIRRGAILILVAILMVVFVAMAAFSVDAAYMLLVRTELRVATDAAARAGAEALSRLQDADAAVEAAIAAGARNDTAGSSLTLTSSDVILGSSELQPDGSWLFTAGGEPYSAMMVNGRRTANSASGAVPLFFGRLLGVDFFAPEVSSVATQLDRDICIVLDRSGSMAFDLSGSDWHYPPGIPDYPAGYCTPPHPTLSRWAAAATSLDAFLDKLTESTPVEHASLVTFASAGGWCSGQYSASDIEVGLTSDFAKVKDAMATRSESPIPGGTSISAGIDTAVQLLTSDDSRRYAAKTIVLMTDGVHNSGRSPISSAEDAIEQNIVIHTITFSDGADQQQMQEVAKVAQGNHYHAPDAEALTDAFVEIALTLSVVLTK